MITEIKEGYSFTDCTTFFGAKMYDTHTLEETEEGLKLTHTLVVTGAIEMALDQTCGSKVDDTLPEEMENLVKLARGINV